VFFILFNDVFEITCSLAFQTR